MSVVAYRQQVLAQPLGALPMQYNGGFAGEADSPRLSSNVGFTSARWTYGKGYHLATSYDQFIPALRSGIGVSAHYQRTDNAYYTANWYGFTAAVAPKISLGGKWTLSPSLDLSYQAGQSIVRDGLRGVNVETEGWRSRAGLLFNTSKFYVGYSVAVIDHLSIRYANGVTKSGRPFRLTSYLQIGYTFQRSPESNFSFTPQLTLAIGSNHYSSFTYDDRIGINYFEAFHLNFRYKQFIWGVNNTGVHVGWQSSRFRIMSSNTFGIGGRNDGGYSGNVSLRYLFKE
jgi:hypothetical protein